MPLDVTTIYFHRDAPSSRNCTPVRSQVLRRTERQGEDCVGRIGCTTGREDARPRDIEIWYLVGLAVAVDHGIRCAGTHDGTAHQMDSRNRGAYLPHFPGACRTADLQAFL